ncbi:hypothetical protein [Vallitalea maricola]|uniref:Uncharacterized protein n=1 Tax=Vallitalea maricola TaxID=3074433 RepID=A0ACB5UK72_9FIRM|nr:hypothetical protein AN2V17_21770 [Vallitalea sp. AN17-2]
MKKIFMIVCIFILTLTSCIYVEDESKSKYDIQKGKKITDTYYYEVKENFEGIKLNIQLDIEEGKVEFELKNPNGDIEWSNVVEGEINYNETKEFEKVVGKWTLNFNSIDNSAQGNLKIKFNKK